MTVLVPADLLVPSGRLTPALFPADDSPTLTARLQAYLDAGTAALASSTLTVTMPAFADALRWYAYWQAYTDVYTDLALTPQSASLTDQGSVTFGPNTARMFKDMADKAERAYIELLPLAPTDVPGTASRSTSGAITNQFNW